uniref:3-hydroxyisobutyrate dehydrogenase n=1 Tax=Psilocybe cubensis TaxID=181762 RepID=A0A8H8CNZ4_PSICU
MESVQATHEYPKRLGWIGLGAMGFPMALRIAQCVEEEGFTLSIYDIDTNAMDRFVESVDNARRGEHAGPGVEIRHMGCAREVAENSDCIITIVPEGAHVKAVFLTPDTGLLAAIDISGKIFIDCSTIDIATSQLINESISAVYTSNLQSKEQVSPPQPPHFFDAPVSGGTARALSGTLTIMLGASSSSPLLPIITKLLAPLTSHPGSLQALGGPTLGLAAKLSNNYLSGLIALATSEAMNLGMRMGVDPVVLQRCFKGSSGASWVNEAVNPVPGVCPDAVTSKGYEGGFKIQLMKKDMGLAVAAAKQVGANLVLADAGLAAYSAAADDPRCRDRAIWGFYEHLSNSETKDELGSLNLLTPSRILRASQNEIKLGRVCSLNWEVHKPHPAGYARKGLDHRVFRMTAVGATTVVDDEVSMNTQCGSQWDGLKHWSYYKTRQFYNGLPAEEVLDENGNGTANAFDKPMRNGIHAFQGKIVGRGVLLDYYSFAIEKGISFAPYKHNFVTADDLDECAKAQNVTFEQGDILFIRMGFVHWYENATDEERKVALKPPTNAIGVKQGLKEVEWLWDHHFAAVASDTPAFEARPNKLEWNLHDYLIALWGTPMGELFDLEELSNTCKELGRYSFFVTSSPLNVVNGIASPPNALAIF